MCFYEHLKQGQGEIKKIIGKKKRIENYADWFTMSILITGPSFILWGHLGFDVPLTPGKKTQIDGQS